MDMQTGAATAALTELRQHATAIIGHVGDFHTKFEQLEQKLETRFTALQQAEQALVEHLGQERDRAREETQNMVAAMQEGTQWVHQTESTLKAGTAGISEGLGAAEHGSEAGSATTQQGVEHLQQLAQKAHEDYQQTGQQIQEHVEQAHAKAHEEFTTGLGHLHETVSSASDQHAQAIDGAVQNDLHGAQTEAHAHIEQVATQATSQLHERGDKLHQDIDHEVSGLAQHEDQHHQDLSHHLDGAKQDLGQLGTTLTSTAHGLGEGVDGATLLLQQTNLGVQEILKIIQNIEQIFQEIVGQYNG